jgi:hypothetical protein
VSSSNLIRWGGLAALAAGVLFIIVNLVTLFVLGFEGAGADATSFGLFFRSAIAPVAGTLLLLGLVGLYVHQSEAAGVPGLISFLVAFVGTVLAQSFAPVVLLASLGWALFGVSCLRAGLYPPIAAVLLIIGAVGTGVVRAFASPGPGAVLVYVGADIVLNVAIAWLGFSLFKSRGEEARRA